MSPFENEKEHPSSLERRRHRSHRYLSPVSVTASLTTPHHPLALTGKCDDCSGVPFVIEVVDGNEKGT